MFSVVIPLYNKAHTIESTLKTLLNQTYTDFEVVIVDDGSTDNGVEVIRQFTTDPRIRIITQENQGVSVARNRGIMEATQPWISFLDADDEWLPGYLEKVKLTIQQVSDVGMVLTGRYGQNFFTRKRLDSTPSAYWNKIQQIEFFHNPHVFAHISATTIRRDLLQNNIDSWGGFVPGQRSNEDFLFLFRVALHTKVAYCGYALAIYNGGVAGQATSELGSQQKIEDSILFHNLVLKEWLRTNRENRSFKVFMKYEIRHCIYMQLKAKNYTFIKYFISGLERDSINSVFTKTELLFYQEKAFNLMMIFFIGVSKVRWRLRGYPVVGG